MIRAPRGIPGARGVGPFQGAPRPAGSGPLLAARARARRPAPRTRAAPMQQIARKTLGNQRGNRVRPETRTSIAVPSGNGALCATAAVVLVSVSTSEVAGPALGNAMFPPPRNARNLAQKQCILPETH